jgi:hypothetical protein
MKPGTRSTAQSYKPTSDNDRSSEHGTSPPEPLGMEYDGRETVRLQRFETNRYKPNSGYHPTSPMRSQSTNMDIPRRMPHQAQTPIRQSPLEEESMAVEETSSLLLRSPNKPNLRDGRVRIRPRGCSLVSFFLACLSVAFLGLVAHSFLNLQRDPKGCKMSFMYPSYAKLRDFDTEHTRFATKYSLYLYREQKMDLSMEVYPYSMSLINSQMVSLFFSSLETPVAIVKSVRSQQKQLLNSSTHIERTKVFSKMEFGTLIFLLVTSHECQSND